jgi:hypothetical protein
MRATRSLVLKVRDLQAWPFLRSWILISLLGEKAIFRKRTWSRIKSMTLTQIRVARGEVACHRHLLPPRGRLRARSARLSRRFGL